MLALHLSDYTFAQLRVANGNKVMIGSSAPSESYDLNVGNIHSNNIGLGTAPSAYRIDINGDFRLLNMGYSDIIFDNDGYYGGGIISPENNNTGYLGKSDKAFKTVYAYAFTNPSDGRQKENIREIKGALDMVLKIEGIKYDLKKEYAYDISLASSPAMKERLEKERKDKYGFIAQDLQKVIPEATRYDDSTDVYTVEYIQIIPVLAEAIKEQQELILKLEEKIKSAATEKQAAEDVTAMQTGASLGKNHPNPFNEQTWIEYYIPAKVNKASIYIYDLQGKQIKSYSILGRGEGTLCIQGNELQAGMYYYSLIIDNSLAGTEKMVLTD